MRNYLVLFILLASGVISANTIPGDSTKTVKVGKDCSRIEAIYIIIDQAIEAGAPTYNAGNHQACYLIYEGAAYKILHKYGFKCTDVSNLLEAALEKSYGNYNATNKAWIMRMAFDQILGEPTKTTK